MHLKRFIYAVFQLFKQYKQKKRGFCPSFLYATRHQSDIKVTSNIHFVLFKNTLRFCFSVSNSFIHKHLKRFMKFCVLDFSF